MQSLQCALAVAEDAKAAKAIFEEQRTILGHRHGAGAALKKLAAEVILEPRDAPADFRFWKAKEVTRLGEAFRFHHLREDD
jgi:hypothetical protein